MYWLERRITVGFSSDNIARVGNTYGGLTDAVKENIFHILFGGSIQNQLFIENLTYVQKSVIVAPNILHSLKEDNFEDFVIPVEVEK